MKHALRQLLLLCAILAVCKAVGSGCGFYGLPLEMVLHIFSFIPPKGNSAIATVKMMADLKKTCVFFRDVCTNNTLLLYSYYMNTGRADLVKDANDYTRREICREGGLYSIRRVKLCYGFLKNLFCNYPQFPLELFLKNSPLLSRRDANGNIILHEALKKKSKGVAELLIRAGSDVNEEDVAGKMPIIYPIFDNDIVMVDTLLKAGARTNDTTPAFWNPMNIALLRKRYWFAEHVSTKIMVVQLLANNEKILRHFNTTDLHRSILADNAEQFVKELSAGADINQLDSQGATALFYASLLGRAAMAVQLLRQGATMQIGPQLPHPISVAASHDIAALLSNHESDKTVLNKCHATLQARGIIKLRSKPNNDHNKPKKPSLPKRIISAFKRKRK